jgi:hypothetical protein
VYGRLPVYLGTIFLATIFEVACAVAPSAPALLVLRFIAGLVSSAPLSNAGGTLVDIGNNVSRTLMLPLFTTCGFVGPVMGPIIGGFLVENEKYGWRWCYWVIAIWNALAFVVVGLFMPETLATGLMKMKATRFRQLTGEQGWRARIEDESLKEATLRALVRPFKMLLVEPALQFFVLYLLSESDVGYFPRRPHSCSVVYIVLYGSFSAYPYIFAAHGLSEWQIGLTFLPVLVGFFLLLLGTFAHYRRYTRLARDAVAGIERRGIHAGKVEPEERLVPRELARTSVSPLVDSVTEYWGYWCVRERVCRRTNRSHVGRDTLPRRSVLARVDFLARLSPVDPHDGRCAIRHWLARDLPRLDAVHDRRVRPICLFRRESSSPVLSFCSSQAPSSSSCLDEMAKRKYSADDSSLGLH